MEKSFYIYILSSKPNGTLYVGVTSDLIKRIWEHKTEAVPGFTKKYDVKTLVYYEQHLNAETAFKREKQLKKWRRRWKLELIEKRIQNGVICMQLLFDTYFPKKCYFYYGSRIIAARFPG